MKLSTKLVKSFSKILNKIAQSPWTSREVRENYRRSLESGMAERNRIENALRGIEKRYRAIFELSPEAILLLDGEGKILDANRKLYNWLGYKPEEVIEKSFWELPAFPMESIKAVERFFRQADVLCEPPNEIDFVSRSGEKRVGRMFSSAMKNESGEMQHLVMIADITECKRAARELQEVSEREAQAYAQGRMEIISTILHNIGNAINSINIGIGTIQESMVNNRLTHHLLSLANAIKEHQDDLVDYIKNDPQGQKVAPFTIALADDFGERDKRLAKTASRVYERTEYIAALIRMEEVLDEKSVYRRDVNLEDAIDNAIATLQDFIVEREIEIIVDYSGAPEKINVQESKLHQMLVDLIRNSGEAIDCLETSAGLRDAPFIRIGCHTEFDSLVLDITDNGIGIEQDKLELILDSDYIASTTESGFWLHSAANFAKECGGQIQALSDDIGLGTAIRIILPIRSSVPI